MYSPGKGIPLELQGEQRQAKLLELGNHWTSIDFNQGTRLQMQNLVDTKDFDQLEKALVPRITFGTAGLRAKMTAGYAYMNHVTVQQAAQGLLAYLRIQFSEESLQKGVVIGHDARHNSKEYAELSAAVFLSQNVPVYMFSQVNPTPFVAFGVVLKGAVAGVMVTASHNPKEDNGYKVYWSNGAQIVDPHDSGIQNAILENLELWDLKDKPDFLWVREESRDIYQEVLDAYISKSLDYSRTKPQNSSSEVIVYTPLHGVGWECVSKLWEAWGFFKLEVPELQKLPDPEFPTVEFPNPEEGQGTLKQAIQKASEIGAKLVLANDPDADRLGVAELQADGTWRIFTGDEIAFFFMEWEVSHYSGAKPGAVVASTVSSKLTKVIAEANGLIYEEVLTGFKWIVKKIYELEQQGYHVLFSFEEAIGFCIGSLVRDKDGMLAACVFNEMYQERCTRQGITLSQHLKNIRRDYGQYFTRNSYFYCYSTETKNQVFESLRNPYPAQVGGVNVKYVRDLTVGYDNSQPDNIPVLPVSKSTQMITFTFENGTILTLRTSGTEPKIKYYSEHHSDTQENTKSQLDSLVNSFISEVLKPEVWGLESPQ